jgi:hypothetical protein
VSPLLAYALTGFAIPLATGALICGTGRALLPLAGLPPMSFSEAWAAAAAFSLGTAVLGLPFDPEPRGALVTAGIAASLLAALFTWWWRKQRRHRSLLLGAKSLALIKSMTDTMRERAKPRGSLRPVPVPAGGGL